MTGGPDRASTLMLFPAALLVVVALAALTVDLARLHLARRELDDLAASTVNDVVTVALDEEALRATGEYRLRADRIHAAVATSLDRPRPLLEHPVADVHLRRGSVVVVGIRARVTLPFSRALPGAPGSVTARAEASASARLR
jgi:hypothetical protein